MIRLKANRVRSAVVTGTCGLPHWRPLLLPQAHRLIPTVNPIGPPLMNRPHCFILSKKLLPHAPPCLGYLRQRVIEPFPCHPALS
jgi:hypothetical protein